MITPLFLEGFLSYHNLKQTENSATWSDFSVHSKRKAVDSVCICIADDGPPFIYFMVANK